MTKSSQILLSLSCFSIFCLMNRCQETVNKKLFSLKIYPFFSAHFKSMLLYTDCEQSLICSKHKSAIECDNALAHRFSSKTETAISLNAL